MFCVGVVGSACENADKLKVIRNNNIDVGFIFCQQVFVANRKSFIVFLMMGFCEFAKIVKNA